MLMRFFKTTFICLTVLLVSVLLIPVENVSALTTFVDALDVSTESGGNPSGVVFNSDGTAMFSTETGTNTISEYSCSTGFDISTCSNNAGANDLNISGDLGLGDPQGLAFNSDGTLMFVANDANEILEYSCSTGFDISTCSNNAGANDLDVSGDLSGNVSGVAFNSDGTKMFVADDAGDILEYTCPAFDIDTCDNDSNNNDFDASAEADAPTDLAFSSDGTKMFVTDETDGEVNEYTCPAFDIDTCTFVNAFDFGTPLEDTPTGIAFSTNGLTMFIAGSGDGGDISEYTLEVAFDLFSSPVATSSGGGGSDSRHKTKPTFGLDHNTFRQLVEGGFSFNGVSHDITDNFWTPFEEQEVKIGKTNTFATKVFADKKLRVQEFLFGIPAVGDAHKAELGIEVFYNYDGDIEKVKVIQKSDIVDESIKVITSKSKCLSDDLIERCVTTLLSMKFLEPLQDKIMAIKAIDFKGRVIITYLNEGFDISGNSLNPMKTLMIAGTEKHEGLVEVTQTVKYSNFWTSQDGREFERNESGSFKQINQSFERHMDTGVMKNRLHSEFADYKETQADLASSIMPTYYHPSINYEEFFSEINDIFAYEYPIRTSKLDNPEIQKTMSIESEKAEKIMAHLLDPILHLK